MPASYRIDKTLGVVVSTWDGVVTFREAIEHNRALGADPDFEPARHQVAEPLDELLEVRLPRVNADIAALPRSDRLQEDVREIQIELKKMASDLKAIAARLAGAGNMTEIIQKMELILELHRETIENTAKRIGDE